VNCIPHICYSLASGCWWHWHFPSRGTSAICNCGGSITFSQGVTLLERGGAKLSVLIGDYHWPWVTVEDWRNVLWSGRSITGALILGFLCAELAKPLIGYPMPPNDRFAALLPFTIATGRVGCLITGCCRDFRMTVGAHARSGWHPATSGPDL